MPTLQSADQHMTLGGRDTEHRNPHDSKDTINPFMPYGFFPSLSFGRIHFEFKGCWLVNFNHIQFLKVHYVCKQCKT